MFMQGCFNPHFARGRSEITSILTISLAVVGFNPHFARGRSEMCFEGNYSGDDVDVSILILRGGALK